MLGVKRNGVTLAPFCNKWDAQYQITFNELQKILGDNIIEMHHVGSTAIKGIVAKPILDIAVAIKDEEQINIIGMESAGYEYCGDRGVPGRHLFVRRINGDVSTHHIHCYLKNNKDYKQVILFCKFLNKHPDYAMQYNDLKIELANKFPDDRVAYTSGKEAFIKCIIEVAEKQT